ncbi:MAG: Asp23/Gls24 family envelope stress response protein [Oscillospiraceae bacterium]|jgi:uncharacterized alkaline shock family protein YloU|nr:Asp23/Gls24 family envelope stress response protein [Oscillospiraceae bacterium]
MGENREYITGADDFGSINISEDVIAVIAGSAAAEADGVHSLYPTYGRDWGDIIKRGLSRCVKLEIREKIAAVEISVVAELGSAVNEVGAAVQKCVANAIESATGLTVAAVNVHICGVSLKKSK